MKFVILTFLLLGLAGCSKTTSESLFVDAQKSCEKEATEESKYYCQMGYVVQKCKFGLLDLKICGTLENR